MQNRAVAATDSVRCVARGWSGYILCWNARLNTAAKYLNLSRDDFESVQRDGIDKYTAHLGTLEVMILLCAWMRGTCYNEGEI